MSRWLTRASLLALVFVFNGCASRPFGSVKVKDTSKTFNTVIVDAGHGGKDSGAFRRFGGAEKNATLDVAKRVDEKLRESQLKTIMTRDSDIFIPLDDRVSILNKQKNAIFVSIHFNDSSRRGIRGFETYYNGKASRPIAERIQSKLLTLPKAANRGVKTANFRVLRLAEFPAVLVECGFLSNRREGGDARNPAGRDKLADKIAEAIVEQRFGADVYGAKPVANPTIEGQAPEGPGLAPSSAKRN
ncbi:MAG: N-acetylmuramoyl-L-alanine amidase [Spartobacteria bacterium]